MKQKFSRCQTSDKEGRGFLRDGTKQMTEQWLHPGAERVCRLWGGRRRIQRQRKRLEISIWENQGSSAGLCTGEEIAESEHGISAEGFPGHAVDSWAVHACEETTRTQERTTGRIRDSSFLASSKPRRCQSPPSRVENLMIPWALSRCPGCWTQLRLQSPCPTNLKSRLQWIKLFPSHLTVSHKG